MHRRRTILKLSAAGIAAWLWPAAVPAASAGGGLYLVNGWLLTEADLGRLGPGVARRAGRVNIG